MAKVKNPTLVSVKLKVVTMHHTTQTADGDIYLKTVFDMSKVPDETIYLWAAENRKIAWRASTGIKEMTTVEAMEKLADATVDCSQTVSRVAASGKRKEVQDTVKEVLAKGMDVERLKKLVADALAAQEAEQKAAAEKAAAEAAQAAAPAEGQAQ